MCCKQRLLKVTYLKWYFTQFWPIAVPTTNLYNVVIHMMYGIPSNKYTITIIT